VFQFDQNHEIRQALLSTGNTTLVESSPFDRLWGNGLGMYDKRSLNRNEWLGENRMGKVLMQVREELMKKYKN